MLYSDFYFALNDGDRVTVKHLTQTNRVMVSSKSSGSSHSTYMTVTPEQARTLIEGLEAALKHVAPASAVEVVRVAG